MIYHTPVLLQEVISFLEPKEGKSYIDATAGYGGHTKALLQKGARVLAIDRDKDAYEYLNSLNLKGLRVVNDNFANLAKIAQKEGFEKADGILFDFGVSSRQLEEAERGFRFSKEGPLDMRMDTNLELKAADIVNNFDERRLNEIFTTYGQEKYSRSIARAICRARQIETIRTTTELAQIIKNAIPRGAKSGNIHPATRAFQALRIVINSELLNLEETLPQTVEILKSGGRVATISFHSLEDGIVKRFFKRETRLKILTDKPIGPQTQEIIENPRSRSAKLRIAERI